MKCKFGLVGLACIFHCVSSHALALASVQTSPGLFTSKPNVCTVDFNTPTSVSACGDATYSAPEGIAAHVVSGDVANVYAQPAGDPTPFLTVGPSAGTSVVISIPSGANYFGFYAGSIDSYNSITFLPTSGSALTLSGNAINGFLTGGLANGTMNSYFNFFTDSLFTSIILGSSSNAFETDNHSFGIASPTMIPEPATTALVAAGVLALAVGGRRKRRLVGPSRTA